MSGEPVRQLRWRLAVAGTVATVVGAVVVFLFLRTFHTVEAVRVSDEHVAMGTALFIVYLALALSAGWVWRARRTRDLWRWLRTDRPAQPRERDLGLREPLREALAHATWWGGATLLVGAFMLSESATAALEHALMIVLGGLTTCAIVYLWVDRLLRPVTVRSLAAEAPARPVGPGMRGRLITAWALASGVPLLGLALLAIRALGRGFEDADTLTLLVLILTGAGLVTGAMAAVLSARSVTDPLYAVRSAMGRVHAGDLGETVAVDDGSEVGLLE